MGSNKKYELLLDAARLMRSLADVLEAIAYTYKDVTAEQPQPEIIEAEPLPALPEEKAVTMEEVRAVLGKKSQAGMTAEVRELIKKYGGARLSDIEPAQYKALLADAEALGNG